MYIFGISVFNTNGDKVAEFGYDAWGNPVSTNYYNSSSNPGVTYSPFRYRGYWYDEETGLYYLNSRYYNPAWGRFLNADIYLNANGGIVGFNMFAYCGNEPVLFWDPLGYGIDPIYGYNTDLFDSYEDYLAGIMKDPLPDYQSLDETDQTVIAMSSEHHKRGTTNPAKKNKHQKGQSRKDRDNR